MCTMCQTLSNLTHAKPCQIGTVVPSSHINWDVERSGESAQESLTSQHQSCSSSQSDKRARILNY